MEKGMLTTRPWHLIKTACHIHSRRLRLLTLALLVFGFAAPSPHLEASKLSEALTQGKVSLNTRYRYELVDQEGIIKKAHASTLRNRLGYKTGAFKGVSVFLEFEDISVIGNAQYNDTSNGKTQYPVVADPEDTEINQAYLQFSGLGGLKIRGGRQRIKLDNDRFIGNVGWRQNEQTFDALLLSFSPMDSLKSTYAYIENVNRIFGAHHPTAARANTRTNTHVIHFAYTGVSALNVSAYGYLLDFENAPTASNKTFGIRLKGTLPVGSGLKILYTAEFADQSDYADGASTVDGDYALLELGGSMKTTTLKVSYEVLSGDGVYGFSTPLATAHAFQGWADKFLTTPISGVEDLYLTLSGKVTGVKLVAIYHIFTSDAGSIDYGSEIDLLAVKKLSDHYLIGAKYASYSADDDPSNTGGTAIDTDKLWLFGQLQF